MKINLNYFKYCRSTKISSNLLDKNRTLTAKYNNKIYFILKKSFMNVSFFFLIKNDFYVSGASTEGSKVYIVSKMLSND